MKLWTTRIAKKERLHQEVGDVVKDYMQSESNVISKRNKLEEIIIRRDNERREYEQRFKSVSTNELNMRWVERRNFVNYALQKCK